MTPAAFVPPPAAAYWRDAARPTLFSAAARPDLIIALLLSHLMSPRTWALAARAVKHAAPEVEARIAAISQFVNRRFHHAGKFDFGRFWGLQERETLTDPVEQAESDYAMDTLLHCMPRSISDAPTIELMMAWLRQGLCPQYVYPPIEIMEALTAVCAGATKRTLGITSCLDECVLMAALAVAAGCCRFKELVLLGSPFHYALFILPEARPGVWLNGKRGMLTAAQWNGLHLGATRQELQAGFDEKMVFCDRLVTLDGYVRIPRGPARLPTPRMQEVAARLQRFLGLEISQAQAACELARAAVAGNAFDFGSRLDDCAN